MAFSDATIDANHWCSRQDCGDVLNDLDRMINADESLLNRCILSATGAVKSHLRGRYPDSFPFTAPPQEIREAVAVVAVYRALRGRTFSGGSLEISDRISDDATEALDWAKSIGDSEANLEFREGVGLHTTHVAAAPSGEFGFSD